MAIAAAVIAADQLTKTWAVRRLSRESCSVPDACIDLIGSLRFRLSFNPGAAFSSFTGGGPVLGVIAMAMTVYLLYLTVTASDRVLRWVFPIVAGGAVGNLADRIFRADDGFLSGKVVDFIDLQFWPIFNVADMAIVGGVIVVAIRLVFFPEASAPASADEVTGEAAADADATSSDEASSDDVSSDDEEAAV